MTSLVFVTSDTAAALAGEGATASYLLVTTPDPEPTATAITDATGLDALSPSVLAANDREVLAGIMEGPILLLIGIAFAAATLVIALTMYSGVVERLREYGVIKAIGGPQPRIWIIVAGQTLFLSITGSLLGYFFYLAGTVAGSSGSSSVLVHTPPIAFRHGRGRRSGDGRSRRSVTHPAAGLGGSGVGVSRVVTMVPTARRMLLTDRRRAVLGILGVAVALVMAPTLDGVFVGSSRQVSRYIDASPADVFVSQQGVRTMHMWVSVLPLDLADRIESVPGVEWAEPILFTSEALQGETGRRPTYVFGYQPGGHGGPQLLIEGSEPGPGELVADHAAAAALGIQIGDHVEVMGRTWTVSGLTAGMTSIINTAVFVRYDDLAPVMGRTATASYILAGTDGDSEGVAARIRSELSGVEVLTRPRFSAEERALVREMSTDLMSIMSIAAFLVGLAVIGLVLTQAAWTVTAAVIAAVAITALIAVLVGLVTLDIDIAPGSVLRTAIAAVIVGLIGAFVPLQRVLRIDPATVFRRPT